MKAVLTAATVALFVSLLGTPFVIRLFRRQGYGQEIREDGPATHLTKRGTPTMGGTVIILATLLGYARRAPHRHARSHGVRAARADGDDRPRFRRFPRRLHQGAQAAQSRV